MSKTVRRESVPDRYKNGLYTFEVIGKKTTPLFSLRGEISGEVEVAILKKKAVEDPSKYLKWYHSDNLKYKKRVSKKRNRRLNRRKHARILRTLDPCLIDSHVFLDESNSVSLVSLSIYRSQSFYERRLLKYVCASDPISSDVFSETIAKTFPIEERK